MPQRKPPRKKPARRRRAKPRRRLSAPAPGFTPVVLAIAAIAAIVFAVLSVGSSSQATVSERTVTVSNGVVHNSRRPVLLVPGDEEEK